MSNAISVPPSYCMSCHKKVEMQNPKLVVLKNGRSAITGGCPNNPKHVVFRMTAAKTKPQQPTAEAKAVAKIKKSVGL